MIVKLTKTKSTSNSKMNSHKFKKMLILQCDECGNVFNRAFNIKNNMNREHHFCSLNCSKNSQILVDKMVKSLDKTIMEKYGVANVFQADWCKDKIKETHLQQRGVEHPSLDPDVIKKTARTKLDRYGDSKYNNRDKNKETCNERYGVDNVFQLEEVKEKIVETNIATYGVEHPMKAPECVEIFKRSCIEKYGVDNPMKHPEFQTKAILTNLERYGVEYPMQSTEVQQKSRDTCMKNHGVEVSSQSPEIIKKMMETQRENGYGERNVEVYSTKMNKTINCRSSYEKRAIEMFDADSSVLSFTYEPEECIISYDHEGKSHLYFPDFMVEYVDGTRRLIEVKPENFTEKPINQSKFRAANEFCDEQNMLFEVYTEKELNI